MKQKEVIAADSGWKNKAVSEFPGSPFLRIGKDWMLITAGDVEKDRGNWNTMTASWGGLGVLWAMDVAFIFIRPSRYTYGFAEKASLVTLSFFDEAKRDALDLCGVKSGRDTNKAAAAGLTPIVFNDEPFAGAIGFMEAKEILICRKLYIHDIDCKNFLDVPAIERHYNGSNYHRMYAVEIIGFKTHL